jgi:molecular chaperone IbpA
VCSASDRPLESPWRCTEIHVVAAADAFQGSRRRHGPAIPAGHHITIALKGWSMNRFDFAPLLRSSVGFENLNRLVDSVARMAEGDTAFPPYNIEKLGSDAYRITMAVAGFAQNELDLTVQENTLIVTGRAAEEAQTTERSFLHRGIAKRAFERRFQLADVIKVTGAAYENGLLNIDLVREVPEHKKPRKVEIGTAANANTPALEGQAAAAE